MKKHYKRVLSVLLCVLLIVGAAPTLGLAGVADWFSVTASAETESGVCGADIDNVTWELDIETGVMTISGIGAMDDFSRSYNYGNPQYVRPWEYYKDDIRTIVVESGVTYIGEYAFCECPNLSGAFIPDSVEKIAWSAFNSWYENVRFTIQCASLQSMVAIQYASNNDLNCEVLSWADPVSGTCGNSLTWSLSEGGVLTISGSGAMQNYGNNYYDSGYAPWYPYRCLISETILQNGVTEIGSYAFYGCRRLTSAAIPDSLQKIGHYAFWTCESLADITLSENMAEIGDYAFAHCYDLASIQIPDAVTSIGRYAFEYCSDLTNATIGSGVTEIADQVFYECTKLASVTIPDGMKTIGYGAFAFCSSLASVTIPDSVTNIKESAFHGCSSLMSVTLPNGIASIESRVFDGCAGLQSITIPDSVTKIGYQAFLSCISLKSITIPSSVVKVGDSAFWNCIGLASIIVCGDATDFGSGVFSDTAYYEDASNWTDGVLYIGNYLISAQNTIGPEYTILPGTRGIAGEAFCYCTELTTITITDSVKTIGHNAFEDCTSLTNITFGSGLQRIGYGAFGRCTGLTQINLPDNATELEGGIFAGCSGLTHVTLPSGITEIGDSTFSGCSGLTSFIIPDGVTSIGQYAFDSCSGLTEIVIPEGVTTISWYAFNSCTSLASVSVPNSLKTVEDYSFYNCAENLKIIVPSIQAIAAIRYAEKNDITYEIMSNESAGGTFSNGLTWTMTRDGQLAISGSGAMEPDGKNGWPWDEYSGMIREAVIHDGVTSIAEYAFRDCKQLSDVSIADSVTEIGNHAFSGCNSLTSVTIPNGVTKISDNTFNGCTSLANISIPDSVTEISDNTFNGCTSLASISIPDSVTKIGYSAFSYCDSLASVKLPNNLTEINGYAFRYCTSLASITIPDCVTEIGYDAFSGCTSLVEVNIGNSVETIGSSAFYGCTSLESIVIPDSVTEIGYDAFSGCTNLADVTIGNGITKLDKTAFENTAFISDEKNWKEDVLYIGNCLVEARKTVSGAYTILSGTRLIMDSAFEECTALTAVTIPQSVTKLGCKVFQNCSALEGVTLLSSDLYLDHYIVYHYSSSGWSVEYLNGSFIGTPFYADTRNWDDGVLYASGVPVEIQKDVTTVRVRDGVTHIPGGFGYGSSAEEVYIPNSVTKIGQQAFCASDVTKVVIGNGIEEIGDYAFSLIDGSDISLPDKEIHIGEGVFFSFDIGEEDLLQNIYYVGNHLLFAKSSNDTIYTVRPGTRDIADGAFSVLGANVKNVVIPGSVTYIGSYAFGENAPLTDVYYELDAEDWAKITLGEGNEILNSITIHYNEGAPAHVHSPAAAVRENEIPATCTEGGSYDEIIRCSVCGEELSRTRKTSDPLGHDFDAWTEIGDNHTRACKRCEAVETETHVWNDTVTPATCQAEGVIKHTCSACGAIRTETTEKIGHDFGAWTDIGDNHTRTCKNCEESETTAHVWGDAVVTPATCQTEGTVTYTCTICSAVKTEKTDKIDHVPGEPVRENEISATCTAVGSYVEVIRCKNCGTELSRTPKTIEKLSHDFGAWTDTGDNHTRTCKHCDETETAAHIWGNAVVTPATCQAEGQTVYTCTVCGAAKTEPIETTDHEGGTPVKEKETSATCTAAGQYDEVVFCKYCGTELSRKTVDVPALGHSFTNYIYNNDATTKKDGTKTAKCDRCDATDTIPAPGTRILPSAVAIKNYTATKTIDYRATITFTAEVQNPASGAQVHWFIDGQDKGTGDTFTVKEAKKNFTVQAKYVKDGTPIAESETETVKVNTGFFARLKAFFRALFGRLPKLVQEYLGAEIRQ